MATMDSFQMQQVMQTLQMATIPYSDEQTRLFAMREWLKAMGETRWYDGDELRDRVLIAVINLSMGQRP